MAPADATGLLFLRIEIPAAPKRPYQAGNDQSEEQQVHDEAGRGSSRFLSTFSIVCERLSRVVVTEPQLGSPAVESSHP
jgi:hypothetical protein